MLRTFFCAIVWLLLYLPLAAAETMDNERLHELIVRVAPEAEGQPGYWRFQLEQIPVTVVTDEKHDRMRILVPIAQTSDLDQAQLYRILQANFDSALDARYAIAKDILWGAFIHPLAALDDEQFLSGLGQTLNLALTFGGSYSSGALVFQGGDAAQEQGRALIDELIRKGLAI